MVPLVLPVFEGEYIGWGKQFVSKPENNDFMFDDLLGGVKPGKKKKCLDVFFSEHLTN